MNVTLTRVTERPIEAIEEAASNCYDSKPTADGKIMKACYQSGHHAVLEFVDFTFHLEGVSRALLAQLSRHRIASFAVRSQRYVKENGFKFATPNSIAVNRDAALKYQDHMDSTRKVYCELLELGIPAEDARFVLPNACDTVIEVKMNGRELIHFMNERLCTRAQWEIRDLAQKMKQCVMDREDCAEFAKFLVPKCKKHSPYNFCVEKNCCGMSPKLKDVYVEYLSAIDKGDEANE